MKLSQIRWGRALVGVLIAEVVLVAAAFAWVAFYSYAVHRGESPEFYQRYAQHASPWVSLVLGFPVFYFAARWAGARTPATAWPTAMTLFGIFFLIELPLLLLAPENPVCSAPFLAANSLGKFLACHFGGRSAAKRAIAVPP
jgi:hypothetical protein